MNTNYEVLNYLNLTNPRLGKLYKITGYNPLPEDFVLTEEAIKERLKIGQLECKHIPDFVFESKSSLKKHLKISIKNITNILKKSKVDGIESDFVKKMEFYFNTRREVTQMILKDFDKVEFDEVEAYLEIFALNPIFDELLPELYEAGFDISKISVEFQKKYAAIEKAKLKAITEKQTKNKKKTQIQQEMLEQNIKTNQKVAKRKQTAILKQNNQENTWSKQ